MRETCYPATAASARYTPDVFEQDGVADGDRVREWKNVANICYQVALPLELMAKENNIYVGIL